MAQGGSQATNGMSNGTPTHPDHGRKPSVVISASGASGYTPNGGPVSVNGKPLNLLFGSMNAQGSPMAQPSQPYQNQQSSLPAPPRDPRVTTPAHSPSPIPQPAASGGRPPSGLQGQNNGLSFGDMGGDGSQMQPNQVPTGPLAPGMPVHERRQSSQSLQADQSMQNMNRNFAPPGGRGRSYPQQPYNATQSPAQSYRSLPSQPRGTPNQFAQQLQPGQMPPGSPYNRGRNSPAGMPTQPHVPQGHMGGNPQMQYAGYPQHLGPQHQMYGMQSQFDPYGGHYPPYYYGQYPGQGPPQSPRPQYPSGFAGPQGPMQPPYHPPSMSRSASQASERPASSLGQPQTPSMPHAPAPSQTPVSSQQPPVSSQQPPQQQSTAFVRPAKKSSAIKITNDKGEALTFSKPSPSPSTAQQPQTPVIVSTPNAPTPPPRAPSGQHTRAESTKPTMSAEETKNAFQEQVKRQMEEAKRKKDDEDSTKVKVQQEADDNSRRERVAAEAAAENQLKEAAAEAEEAAAKAAEDEKAEEEAAAAATAATAAANERADAEAERKRLQEEEDERLEREIAEMEAREREEEEREKAYQEKRAKEKAEAVAKEAEASKNGDEDLKRQELEAEERELAREREREAEREGVPKDETKDEPEEAAKSLFAALKKPNLGPGASAPQSGTETPITEDAAPEPGPGPQAALAPGRTTGAPKSKPAHLKLETNRRVEPAEPTPGMQALKSARFLEVKEDISYPDGFKSPNPALNTTGMKKGRAYDKDFLLQFQPVFKEKPTVDWDQKIKDTLGPGDEPGSARLQTGRAPSGMGPRTPSARPGVQAGAGFGGPMGNFGGQMGTRTLPVGTTSQERFNMSQMGGRPMGASAPMQRAPSQLGMGNAGVMSRTASVQSMNNMSMSPRQQSARGGRGPSKRDPRAPSKREEAEMASKMPLTAGLDLKPLLPSGSGWKPTSIGQGPIAQGPDLSGNMAPDMVQRKVKAALNKMTPEKFDKISDQILEIAGQSKTEIDGRTLRQVIQLTFEKACDEAHWAGMYAKFCHKMLTAMSGDIRDETIRDKNGNPVVGGALFRKYLLNRCQEEFERGWQANLPEKPEGENEEAALLSDEYYIAAAAKRRGLGLIQFIGQLYKLGMLTVRIMHECVVRLLNFEGDPDEAAIENLTTLLRAVGLTMDESEQGHPLVNSYFERIDQKILASSALASRPRFMVMDLIDLRKAGWKGKNVDKGPKTLQQVHDEAQATQAKADAERQRQNQRGPQGGRPMGRGDGRNFSGQMAPPVDYSRTTVGMDDLRRLQNRGQANRQAGTSLGPGGSLGPSGMLGARASSRRGAGPGAPSSGNTTRTNTPPVENKDKKDEPTSATNAFSALASLDSTEAHEDVASQADSASPPTARNRSKSPLLADKAQEAS